MPPGQGADAGMDRWVLSAREHARRGERDAAKAAYAQALQRRPQDAGLLEEVASALGSMGETEAALFHYESLVRIKPDHAAALYQVARLCFALGKIDRSYDAFRACAALIPTSPDPILGWLNTAMLLGKLQEAGELLDRPILKHAPEWSVLTQRALHLQRTARHREAAEAFRRCDALTQGAPAMMNLGASALNYAPGVSPRERFEWHRLAGQRFEAQAQRLYRPPATIRDPRPDRRLRVGYLSADLLTHAVASFLEPMLTHRDRDGFELFAYSARSAPSDAVQRRLRALMDHWREVGTLSDDAAADLIARDGIDILIELSGHSGGQRLGIVARKPAPILVTYLGYPATTGLSCVHARIVDAITDPPGLQGPDAPDACHTERLIRLDGPFSCFREPDDAPDVTPATALDRPTAADGTPEVVFGSFNYIAKVSDAALALWARVLDQVPGSRLAIKSHRLDAQDERTLLRDRFVSAGGDAGRLTILPPTATQREHLARYAEIDVALDTVPYCGTTTTCEALFMGAPVVTLRGDWHGQRVGASILTYAGLPELIAEDHDAYVRIAAGLARDADRRASLRSTLRARLLTSPLMDGPGFMRRFEGALRTLWTDRLAGLSGR